jgi:hypothetical protein
MNTTNIILDYNNAEFLIRNADILLFPAPSFPSVGWWISKYTNSPYSHAALAYWEDNKLYCLEFREFKGSRQYLLKDYIDDGQKIDVFRAMNYFEHPIMRYSETFGYVNGYDAHTFNNLTAKNIVNEAKQLLGLSYSWSTILKMGKTYIPFLRFKDNHKTNDEWHETHSYVCSTLVTYCYRKCFVDPVPFLADRYTSPGDLARSGLFWKLFSIK